MSTINIATIEALIKHLELVRQPPGMYIGPVEYFHLANYLDGIYMGFRLLGAPPDLSNLKTLTCQHGWKTNIALGAYPDMKKKGLNETEIVQEELTIHIECWQEIVKHLSSLDVENTADFLNRKD